MDEQESAYTGRRQNPDGSETEEEAPRAPGCPDVACIGCDRVLAAPSRRRVEGLLLLLGRDYQRVAVPRSLEFLPPHKEDHAVVMRVPDADFLGAGSSTSCQNDGTGIFAEDEERTGESGCLQPLPIEPGPFGLESEFVSKLYQARGG